MDPTHRTMIWDVMFYAHNTRGRWAASYVTQCSYCRLYSSTTHSHDGQDGLGLLMVGGAAAIVITSAIVAIYLKRRGG
jgi:cytosine/uracil/thiamine/allantoin permease